MQCVAQDVGRAAVRSEVRVGFLRGGAYDVATIPMETYVARVLAGEAARESPSAALEALAIAIRTYAAANRGRHRADGFDLCDQTHCQVVRAASSATERAALATAGQVLLFDGRPAAVFYSASCGGRTERAVGGLARRRSIRRTFRRSLDDACQGQPEWTAELRAVDLQRALAAAGFRGTLRSMRIASRNESGRVAQVDDRRADAGRDFRAGPADGVAAPAAAAAGSEHVIRSDGDSDRLPLRGTRLRPRRRDVRRSDPCASPHGGVSAASILERYFPGTIACGPVRRANGVSLSGIDERLRAPRSSRWPRPRRVELRCRPRRDAAVERSRCGSIGRPRSIEQASGRPWFTSGTIVDGEMHLLPLGMLRDRGMLELTVRRQLTRLLTERELAGKPLWVREGTALHFGDRPDDSAAARLTVRGSCPSDDELARPVSPGRWPTRIRGRALASSGNSRLVDPGATFGSGAQRFVGQFSRALDGRRPQLNARLHPRSDSAY